MIFFISAGHRTKFSSSSFSFPGALSVQNNYAHMRTLARIKKYGVFIVKLASLKLGGVAGSYERELL